MANYGCSPCVSQLEGRVVGGQIKRAYMSGALCCVITALCHYRFCCPWKFLLRHTRTSRIGTINTHKVSSFTRRYALWWHKNIVYTGELLARATQDAYFSRARALTADTRPEGHVVEVSSTVWMLRSGLESVPPGRSGNRLITENSNPHLSRLPAWLGPEKS